ncbi:AI-2E family transporter [Pseudonocardia sp. CA-107938]|uniref:AI-2E family transporter n=1 Tax=Pseudonocardia sp. CA-107938 TaxID=3240021 RepID=UPI003D90A66E
MSDEPAAPAPVPAPPLAASPPPPAADRIPTPLRVVSDLAWRFLVIAAALGLLLWLVVQLRVVVIPVAISVLLAALLGPVVVWLADQRVPRGIATVLVLIGGIALLGGLLTFVVNNFIAGLPDLQTQLTASFRSVQDLLQGPPLNLPADWLSNVPAQLNEAITANREALTSGALSTAATVGEVVAGMALVLFSVIFFLYDGPQIWTFLLRAAPRLRRERVDVAGRRAFASLVGYVRATVLVAIVDAVGIGVGLAIVGVPLVIPLAALVFLGAFIPTVGAVLTGAIAVLIALVANGPIAAVIILAVVVGVQQLEGHVLQPLLLGRAVSLHPLAVVLSVAAGVVVAGITGALLAVPLLAVINTAVRSLIAPVEQTPVEVDAVKPRHAHPVFPEAEPAPPGWLVRLWRRLNTRPAGEEPADD